MPKTYTLTISIRNEHGEILERDYKFPSFDDARMFIDKNTSDFLNDAESYAKKYGMYLEELYNSKEEAEFDKEDTV